MKTVDMKGCAYMKPLQTKGLSDIPENEDEQLYDGIYEGLLVERNGDNVYNPLWIDLHKYFDDENFFSSGFKHFGVRHTLCTTLFLRYIHC